MIQQQKMKISGISPKWIERMANNVRCSNDVRHRQTDKERKNNRTQKREKRMYVQLISILCEFL